MAIIGGPKRENPKHANERFITPPELCLAALKQLPAPATDTPWILDPGCASGNWGTAAREIWPHAYIVGVDLEPAPTPVAYDEYQACDIRAFEVSGLFDFVIGNPPFTKAAMFVAEGMRRLKPGGWLVFVMELTYLSGQGRYRTVHKVHPIEHVSILSERPSFSGDGKTAVGREYAAFYFQNADAFGNRLPTFDFLDWTGNLNR